MKKITTSLDVFNYLKNHYVIGNGLGIKDCDYIVMMIDMRNYLQILYDYGENILLVLLEMFEEKEQYEQCNYIMSTIESYNKVSGKNLRTRL